MRLSGTILLLLFFAESIRAQQFSNDSFEKANSGYDELNPVLSPDGRTLFITIANHPQNIGGKRDAGDIWYSVLNEQNQWSNPVNAGPRVNDRAFNGIAGFSADGRTMFLLSHYDASGNPVRSQGLAVSRAEGTQWTPPQNIPIPYFQNKSSLVSGFVSADESCFVFSAETYGTHGVEDLYVSLKSSEGKWSEPRNLGNRINTQFQELCPSLSADGKTLYFSSNGRKGYGSFDVYSATRLDDTWTNWSDPENLGIGVNTEGRDLFYRNYSHLGFSLFTTTKNSDGYGVIRMFRESLPPVADTAIIASSNPDRPDEVSDRLPARVSEVTTVTVRGSVVNAKTGERIPATIKFTPVNGSPATNKSNFIQASVTSGYSLVVPAVDNYNITIESKGFVSALEKLDIRNYEMADLEMNFHLQPVEIGTIVNLKSVLFEQSKTALLPESHNELDVVVSFLKENPEVKIELAGHTDNRGIVSQNLKLSQARVDKVKAYLVSKGISGKRISGKGYGGSRPIASNESEETRQLNRRVEFVIKKY